MKFEDTALHFVFWKIATELKGDCLYITVLKIPMLILFLVIGVPIAIILDFIEALKN